MSNKFSLAAKIKALKPGQSFKVVGKSEREMACRIGKNLRDAGAIEFEIVTRCISGDEFKVAAI